MTLTEKIIAKACSRSSVSPNDNVWVNTDVLMTHDVCGPGTIGNFYKEFGPKAKVNKIAFSMRFSDTPKEKHMLYWALPALSIQELVHFFPPIPFPYPLLRLNFLHSSKIRINV